MRGISKTKNELVGGGARGLGNNPLGGYIVRSFV